MWRPSLLAAATATAVSAADTAPCDIMVQSRETAAATSASGAWASARRVASLHDAWEVAEGMLRDVTSVAAGDVVVCLDAGVHDVAAETLAVHHHRGGGGGGRNVRRVRWRGLGTAAEPSTISGGVQLTAWSTAQLHGATVFAADLSPAAKAGLDVTLPIRHLWVGGHRAARTKGSVADVVGVDIAPWTSADGESFGFTTVDGRAFPASWADPATLRAVEFTWRSVIANWIEPRCTVAAMDADRTNITMASPCAKRVDAREAGYRFGSPVAIEAAPMNSDTQFTLPPGAFYHERGAGGAAGAGRVLYAPRPGDTLASVTAGAWVSAQETLVRVHGDEAPQVFENVRFAYSTWRQANTGDGYVDTQSAVYACTAGAARCLNGMGEPLGAVELWAARDVAFTGCTFEHIGGGYALSAMGGSQDIAVRGTLFNDLSGGAVRYGSVSSQDASSTDESQWDKGYILTNSVARASGIEYAGAAAIFIGYITSGNIAHNTISDAGYTAISVGWGWGRDVFPGYGNNSVTYNRMQRIMTAVKDGGGIYVNGATNPAHGWNTMAHNWVDRDEEVFGAYYLDNGASHWRVYANVVSNSSKAWAYFMTGGTGDPVDAARNNHVERLWYQDAPDGHNNCPQYNCSADDATIVRVAAGAVFPAEAKEIMDTSGARGVMWK